MLAAGRVDTGFLQHKPLHRISPDDMRLDDFVNVIGGHSPVPDRIGIDHQVGTMLTLVEAARLVRAHFSFEPTFLQLLLEKLLQRRLALGIATSARMPRRALIAADENMLLELRHYNNVQEAEFRCQFSVLSSQFSVLSSQLKRTLLLLHVAGIVGRAIRDGAGK